MSHVISASIDQRRIIDELGVQPHIDMEYEREQRIAFLSRALISTDRKSLVLGVSGGIDSTLAAYLAQQAMERTRREVPEAAFIAMRLPYGVQLDEEDAQRALAFIEPDVLLTTDIKPASDAMLLSLTVSGLRFNNPQQEDFILGSIKARQRMIAQYAVAGAHSGLVVGTDHAAEALLGFFTKHGDGAADLTPLSGLNKRQVRALAAYCGAPAALVNKVPTADLETLSPLKPDETAFGVSYDEIDDFLEGKVISTAATATILRQFHHTAHKRRLPVSPEQLSATHIPEGME